MSRATSSKDETREPVLGHWWRPDEPMRRVAGRLTFSADGPIELELLDLLVDGDVGARHAAVLGTSADGQAITLEDLQWIAGYNRDWVRFGQALRRETFMVDAAYLGAHLPRAEQRMFDEATITLSDLLTWAGPSGIDEQSGPHPAEVTVSLTLPAAREVPLSFGLLTLAHGWTTRGEFWNSREIAKSVGFVVRIHDAWESGVNLSLTGPDAKAHFQLIKARYGDQVDARLAPLSDLEWRLMPDNRESQIMLRRLISPADPATWPQVNAWMASATTVMHDLFRPIVKNLNASDWHDPEDQAVGSGPNLKTIGPVG